MSTACIAIAIVFDVSVVVVVCIVVAIMAGVVGVVCVVAIICFVVVVVAIIVDVVVVAGGGAVVDVVELEVETGGSEVVVTGTVKDSIGST